MRAAAVIAVALLLAVAPLASAHPGAAPWEADGRPGRDTCATTCHFETAPVRGSGKLQLLGLPERPEPGKLYELAVVLKHAGMRAAGFLLGLDPGGGAFEAASNATETKDAAIRSTLAEAKQKDEARWTLKWRAPAKLPAEVVFYLSANAGNDDQSPFGDRIYLETVKAEVGN